MNNMHIILIAIVTLLATQTSSYFQKQILFHLPVGITKYIHDIFHK